MQTGNQHILGYINRKKYNCMDISSYKLPRLRRKIGTGLRMGNLKKETESLLISAQSYAITTNYVKAKIGYLQQNNKCRLCDESGETINHIVSEYRNLRERSTMIHWELYKTLKCDNTTKRYMRKSRIHTRGRHA